MPINIIFVSACKNLCSSAISILKIIWVFIQIVAFFNVCKYVMSILRLVLKLGEVSCHPSTRISSSEAGLADFAFPTSILFRSNGINDLGLKVEVLIWFKIMPVDGNRAFYLNHKGLIATEPWWCRRDIAAILPAGIPASW